MTTLIQQRSPNDCVLASIAMAAGFAKWDDVWTDDDMQVCIKGKGIADEEPWLARAGIERSQWKSVHVRHIDPRYLHVLLWQRRALVSCASLNNDGGSHMVYWDGERVFDPHEGQPDWLAFKHLSSMLISEVILLK